MHNVKLHHLLSIQLLNRPIIDAILDRAEYNLNHYVKNNATGNTLQGKVVATLFFEPSTRTRNSFVIAAERLGAIVLNPHLSETAIKKGESLLDTIRTFEAMGTSFFVIRHAENNMSDWIAEHVRSSEVINAGDGMNQHPTQGLLDLLTIRQHKKSWENLTVALVGDMAHSRVANSLLDGLSMMNVEEIRLIAPPNLLPTHGSKKNVSVYHSLDDGIKNADVIVTFRLQKERVADANMPEFKSFHEDFCLSKKKLLLAKPDAIVMHPGPINRDVEIASDVVDGPQSVILQQVQNGVAVRMAVFEWLANSV